MFSYSVFGGHLDSEIPFPELRSARTTSPDWTLCVSSPAPPVRTGALLGRGLEPECEVALYRGADGLQLHHSCTGVFEISGDGARIVWTPAPNAPTELARADVFGRVLAVAMHLQGILSLHASAVALERGVVAFVAPKEYGKSTLAMALAASGGRFVTDDLLAIRPDASPSVMPGVQSARLHADSASLLYRDGIASSVGVDGKHVLRHRRNRSLLTGPAPLDAAYVLSPVTMLDDGGVVARTQLSSAAAAVLLVAHAKVGALLGGAEAPVVLRRAAELARSVPVYRLDVVRELDALPDVAARLRTWHAAPALDEQLMASSA